MARALLWVVLLASAAGATGAPVDSAIECTTCAFAAAQSTPHALALLAGDMRCEPLGVLGADAIGVAPGGGAATGCVLRAGGAGAARWCAHDASGHTCALTPRHLDGCLLRIRAPTEDIVRSALQWEQAAPWRGPLELLHWQADVIGPPCTSTLCSHLQLTLAVGLDAAAFVEQLQHELSWGADTYPSVVAASHTCAGSGKADAAVLVQADRRSGGRRRLGGDSSTLGANSTTGSPPSPVPAANPSPVLLVLTVLLRGAGQQCKELHLTLKGGASASAAYAPPGDTSVSLQVAGGTVTVVPLAATLPGNCSVFRLWLMTTEGAPQASLLRADAFGAGGVQLSTLLANFDSAPPPPVPEPPAAPVPTAPPSPPLGAPQTPPAPPAAGTASLLITIGTGTSVALSLLELLAALRRRCSEESTSGVCAPVGRLIRTLIDGAVLLISGIAKPTG